MSVLTWRSTSVISTVTRRRKTRGRTLEKAIMLGSFRVKEICSLILLPLHIKVLKQWKSDLLVKQGMNKAIKPIQVVQTKHVGTCAHCVGYNKRLGPNLTPLHHVYKGVTWLHTSPKVYTYFCAYPKHDFASDWNLLPPSLHFGRRWLPSILCN